MGSSPRVRGKRSTRLIASLSDRLIPACAGKTLTKQLPGFESSAHPRVCGENVLYCVVGHIVVGSSPRVRGKLAHVNNWCLRVGLIPACAGKTCAIMLGSILCGAHPRVCGENFCQAISYSGMVGSSPRVRGKLTRQTNPNARRRLIPACAGKTSPF